MTEKLQSAPHTGLVKTDLEKPPPLKKINGWVGGPKTTRTKHKPVHNLSEEEEEEEEESCSCKRREGKGEKGGGLSPPQRFMKDSLYCISPNLYQREINAHHLRSAGRDGEIL